jgi:hypothetical protein
LLDGPRSGLVRSRRPSPVGIEARLGIGANPKGRLLSRGDVLLLRRFRVRRVAAGKNAETPDEEGKAEEGTGELGFSPD